MTKNGHWTLGLALGLTLTGMAVGEKERVYIGTGGGEGIFMAILDSETGELSDLELAVKTDGANFLTKSKDGKYVYATSRGDGKEGGVSAFAVKKGGALGFLNEVSSKGQGPCMVSLDSTGKVCFVANYGSGSVSAFAVGEDGTLAPSESWHQHEGKSADAQRQTGPHAHSIYIGPENKFVYAVDLGTDEIVSYALDVENAALKRVGEAKVPAGAGARHMKFSKDGRLVYVLNEMGLSVTTFARGEGGKLTRGETVSVLVEDGDRKAMTCSEIVVSPDGKFIYTATRDLNDGGGRDFLSVLKVDENGGLSLLETVSAEVWIPRNINIHPSGKWLLVAGQNKGGVPVFAINQESGKLKFTGERVAVKNAMCIKF